MGLGFAFRRSPTEGRHGLAQTGQPGSIPGAVQHRQPAGIEALAIGVRYQGRVYLLLGQGFQGQPGGNLPKEQVIAQTHIVGQVVGRWQIEKQEERVGRRESTAGHLPGQEDGGGVVQIPVVRQVGRGLGRSAQGGQTQAEGGGCARQVQTGQGHNLPGQVRSLPGKGVGPGRARAPVNFGRRRRAVRRLGPQGKCAGLCRGLGWLPVGMQYIHTSSVLVFRRDVQVERVDAGPPAWRPTPASPRSSSSSPSMSLTQP
ncbi:MAG: hypothetical protein KJZ86_21210 [Caldilineaceae bacterium]|nr:hypothetical protein [Caldilineaceae bacterium]